MLWASPELRVQHIPSADLYGHDSHVNSPLRAHRVALHDADQVGGQALVAPGAGTGALRYGAASSLANMLLVPRLHRRVSSLDAHTPHSQMLSLLQELGLAPSEMALLAPSPTCSLSPACTRHFFIGCPYATLTYALVAPGAGAGALRYGAASSLANMLLVPHLHKEPRSLAAQTDETDDCFCLVL